MAFRIKDLLINVATVSQTRRRAGFPGCPPATILSTAACGGDPTGPNRFLDVWSNFWWCCGPSLIGNVGPGDPVEWAEQLALLKAELKEALQEVERQEAAAEEALRPRDIGEIEELEAKLKEALTELERLKGEMKRK